jgi:hypothetical protein
VETLTGTLLDRVDKLVQAAKTTGEWGDPRLSVTPPSLAIPQLVAQIEALETAVREIALEVQKLSA